MLKFLKKLAVFITTEVFAHIVIAFLISLVPECAFLAGM